MGAIFFHAFVFASILFALMPREAGTTFFYKLYLIALALCFVQAGIDWLSPTMDPFLRIVIFAPICWIVLYYATALDMTRAAFATAAFLIYEFLYVMGMQELVNIISPKSIPSSWPKHP